MHPATRSRRSGVVRPRIPVWAILLSTLPFASGSLRAETPTNVLVSATNNPEETGIAVNPLDPDNVVGCAQVPPRWYASFDGGLAWTEGVLGDPAALGDPAVVFGPDGVVYYSYIGTFGHSGIFVDRSSDGGLTWLSDGVPVVEHSGGVPFEDKSYPACDLGNGPTGGFLYVAWTRFDVYGSPDPADSSRIYFSRSTDGGVSFSPPLDISDRGGDAVDGDFSVEGAVPSPGPDGSVSVAWAGPRGIEFDRSTDGGVAFGQDRVIADQPGGWDFEVPGIGRCNGLPITKTDVSEGPYRGRIYVCWSDQRFGDTDVFLVASDDGGASWTSPRRVNDDPVANGAHQFLPWLDVDPVTGLLVVVFYDRREHPGTLLTDVYVAYSPDGGESFINGRISESPFLPDPGIFFGDYIGVSAYGGRIRPLWMRMDDRVLSVWTALIERTPSGLSPGTGDYAGSPDGFPRLLVRPNPIRSSARFLFASESSPLRRAEGPIRILDAQGRLVRALAEGSRDWDGRDGGGRPVTSGSYFVRAGGGPATRIVVIR